MNRQQFLEQDDIKGFIQWLTENLENLEFSLNMPNSRFVPNGINQKIKGFENLLQHYRWRSNWIDNSGVNQESCDWETTQKSLLKLSAWIRSAIDDDNSDEAIKACLEILRWGGVRGAIPFLKRKHDKNELIPYLKRCIPFFDLDNEIPLNNINNTDIERFDSGITKIHALIDKTGSPIYDSRVGAAVSMLYALYREKSTTPAVLKFPSGSARGQQIRNPGKLGYQNAPQFFSPNVPKEEWGKYQKILGWIIKKTINQSNIFTSENGMAYRCHAFEACLFMIGYDLNCFCNKKNMITNNESSEIQVQRDKSFTWVPTYHPFKTVLDYYVNFREGECQEDNKTQFVKWLQNNKDFKSSTAKSYCFPLRQSEFDLFGKDLKDLKKIATGGSEGLKVAIGFDDEYIFNDERTDVCLMNAYIVGLLYNLRSDDKKNRLVKSGFAGSINTAGHILSVGNSIGIHFGLLDRDGKPTEFYNAFFKDQQNDIKSSLDRLA